MSCVRKKSFLEKLVTTRSQKSFAFHFMLGNMWGQKKFLYSPDYPRVVNISFNERTCMYRCRMCYFHQEETRNLYREKSEMTRATLENLVRDMPNDPAYSFDISAIGETLEFSQLADFIRYMKQQKPLVNVIISTNALLLTPDKSRELIESGLDNIQFSLFAATPQMHAYISGTETFERVKANILQFCEMRRQMLRIRPQTQAFMILSQETQNDAQDFLAFWSQHVDVAFLRPLYCMEMETLNGLHPTHTEADAARRYPCISPWYSVAVRSNGDVLGCYVFHWKESTKDSMVMGNVNESSMGEIWRGEKMQAFRERHLQLDFSALPVCAQCTNWNGYTNIWQEKSQGGFEYAKCGISDLVTPAPAYRGG